MHFSWSSHFLCDLTLKSYTSAAHKSVTLSISQPSLKDQAMATVIILLGKAARDFHLDKVVQYLAPSAQMVKWLIDRICDQVQKK
jgi:hypothetical protein